MTGFFNRRSPKRTEQSGKPLIPVDLPDVVDRTILANQRVAGAPVLRPLERRFLPMRGFPDRCGTERYRAGKAGSEAASHVGFKGDLALETESLREGGQVHKHWGGTARVEGAGPRYSPCFKKMQKKFRCSAPEPQAPVVRVKVNISKGLEFFLVENAIFEPGAH
jgi:hypothetical protein